MTLNLRNLSPAALEPRAVASNHNDHFVELYEDDAALVASIRTFLAIGMNGGEGAVVIATPDHREAIEAELGRVVDLPEARRQGLFTTLDAAETLASFMRAGVVDGERFQSVIGDVLRAAGRENRRVRVFGEMVALLWEAGDVPAALELEDGWNRLAAIHDFRLYCAYRAAALGSDEASLMGICHRHSHVVVPAV